MLTVNGNSPASFVAGETQVNSVLEDTFARTEESPNMQVGEIRLLGMKWSPSTTT
jgi:hypothetical protein